MRRHEGSGGLLVTHRPWIKVHEINEHVSCLAEMEHIHGNVHVCGLEFQFVLLFFLSYISVLRFSFLPSFYSWSSTQRSNLDIAAATSLHQDLPYRAPEK